MTFRELIDALIAGERLADPAWCDGHFVELDEGGNLVDQDGNLADELEDNFVIVPAPLTFAEAIVEVAAGKKVKRAGWTAGREIYLDSSADKVVIESPTLMPFKLTLADITAEDYSVVEP